MTDSRIHRVLKQIDDSAIKLSRFGKIRIELSHSSYFLDEMVSGTVFLDVTQDGFLHDTVFLTLSGVESVVKAEDVHTFKLHNEFYKQSIILHQFPNNRLSRGSNEIPFELSLSGVNATTLHYRDTEEPPYASIQFILSAFINSVPKQHIEEQIFHQTEVRLARHYVPSVKPFAEQQSFQTNSLFGCFPSGKILMNVSLSQVDYQMGDVASIQIHIDNKYNKTSIKQVKVCLVMKIVYKIQGYEKSMNHYFQQEVLSGIASGQEENLHVDLDISAQEDKQYFQTITHSTNIATHYFIEVCAITQEWCCVQYPTIQVPITMVNNMLIEEVDHDQQQDGHEDHSQMQSPIRVQQIQNQYLMSDNASMIQLNQKDPLRFDHYPSMNQINSAHKQD